MTGGNWTRADTGSEIALMFKCYRALMEMAPDGRPAAMSYLRDRLNADLQAGKAAAMVIRRFARATSRLNPCDSDGSPEGGDAQRLRAKHDSAGCSEAEASPNA